MTNASIEHRQEDNVDVELDMLSREDLDRKPWKYIGYKGFARYVSLSDDFFTLRRYDRLHCRVLLTLQDRIARLEEELDLLDDSLSGKNSTDVDNGTVRNDQVKRRELIKSISEELRNYDEMLCSFLTLKARPRASARTIRNIRTWLSNNNYPIERKETEFLDASDLITAAASQKSTIRHLFEHWILCRTTGLFGLFTDKPSQKADDTDVDPSTIHGRDEPVDVLASFAVFVVAFVMLVVPLWILAVTEDMFKRLGVITVFITVLLGVLTSATLAEPFEILAATAG
ncbi:hypothetical protein BJ170DRAFT_681088 [Xylariales sp. AK1849]|nr:hypothetical protein BJ170DRAFT_681088 [Xylariales sp. AK1849]